MRPTTKEGRALAALVAALQIDPGDGPPIVSPGWCMVCDVGGPAGASWVAAGYPPIVHKRTCAMARALRALGKRPRSGPKLRRARLRALRKGIP
jgi:hypothetical protein